MVSYLIRVCTLRDLISEAVVIRFVAARGRRWFAIQASGVLLRQVVSWRHTPLSSEDSNAPFGLTSYLILAS